nr:LCP family protein [Sporohalobacter salinus]
MNFLILGSDASAKGRTRTDVIMVASLNLESGKLGLFSLPRDTKVEIPGKDEDHKLNAAYAYGGPELVVKTVEKLLKVPIDYYVNTDFDGFREIVDTLGGVEVNVEKRLKYIDQAGGLYIDIPAGRQTLFGQEALEYIRFRHDKLGDIGRINRQHKFLKALLKKIYNPKVLLDAPELLRHIKDNVETDLPWLDSLKVVTKVVKVLKDLDQNKVEMVTLPGKAAYIDGISYWIPNQMLMNRVVDSLINSKEYIDNSKLDILVLNGNGKQGAAHQIEDLLSSSGYNVVQVRNADNFNYVQTWIYFKSKASKEAQELAKYLKGTPVKWDDVDDKQDSDIQKEADIKIILGENFNYS